MHGSVFSVVVAAVFVMAIPTHLAAGHIEPAKAKKLQFDLINGFVECDGGNVNTATQSNGIPACAPAVSLGLCTFTPQGSGRLTISKIGSTAKGDQDLKIAAVANGVACEGGQLHLRLSFRLTTDDCPEGSCTTVDLHNYDFNGASCLVTNGKCRIKTTLNTVAPGFIATNGKNAGITILGCGLKEFGFAFAPADLQCGLLLQ